MWKAVEIKTEKVRVAEIGERREKRRSREERSGKVRERG